MSEVMIQADGLVKIYKSKQTEVLALQGLDLTVEKGELTALIGNSGSGKSTFLNMIGGLDRPSAGSLLVDGKNLFTMGERELVCYKRDTVGFVWQNNARNLLPYLSALENIMLPMILGREKESVMTKAAQEYAEKFLISHLVKKNPYELSGGEKQRVAICRALINDPDLVLADEPTGNLDSKSGKIVIDALTQINREFKKTIVMVTHDPQMASYCSRIILLKDGLILDTLKRGESQEAFYQEIIGRMAEL